MKTLRTFFMFEWNRTLTKRNLLFLLFILFFALYFLQSGITEYKSISTRKDLFLELEKEKVSQYINYTQYGSYGFRLLFLPSPLMIFFDQTAVIPDLTAFVDSGERLNIYQPFMGKNAFSLKNFGLTDFSGIILFFGTLLALFYGYETFHNAEYLKFLSSFAPFRRCFWALLLSRMLILSFLLLALMALGLAWVMLNGLHIPIDAHFLAFALLALLLSNFFLLLGSLFGNLKLKIVAIGSMLSCWFLLLFLIPTAINTWVSSRADLITPLYHLEMEKLKILMGFEKRAIEKAGTFEYGKEVTDIRRKVILDYWRNEFTKIHSLEESMSREMKGNITLYQDISMIFPTAFYVSVNREISSRGYEALIDFHRYVLDQKRKFFKFYMDKVYFSNFSQVESFIKDRENLFLAKSRLPHSFWPGLTITLIYIIVLLVGSYHCYRRSLFAMSARDMKAFLRTRMNLQKGELRVWLILGHHFKNLLFILLSGQKKRLSGHGFTGQVSIDGEDLAAQSPPQRFYYLCSPESIPGDIRVRALCSLLGRLQGLSRAEMNTLRRLPGIRPYIHKRFDQLAKPERGEVLLSLTPEKEDYIYLFHDTAAGMPVDFAIHFKEKMDVLKKRHSLVLYLTGDDTVRSKGLEKGQLFFETPTWGKVVEQYKKLEEAEYQDKRP